MGFQKTVEVPEGERLGFVILTHHDVEVMMQTVTSVTKDAPQFSAKISGCSASLFIEGDDFSELTKRLRGYPIAMEERVTFYGMREIGVFDPGGHIVIFAARASN